MTITTHHVVGRKRDGTALELTVHHRTEPLLAFDPWAEIDGGAVRRRAGGFDLTVTDQRAYSCGWSWRVTLPPHEVEIEFVWGCETADEAKRAAEGWVRDFCRRAFESVSNERSSDQ